MSLLSGYSTLNKRTKVGLDVRYRHEIVDGGHLYTRYATKAYGYVGMTYAAAKECAAAKSAQYMRTHRRQSIKEETSTSTDSTTNTTTNTTTYSVDEKSVTERLCSIATTHGSGDAWDVEISVSETETVATLEEASDIEALFSTENAWDYDEEDEGGTTGLRLASVSATAGAGSVSAKVTASGIGGFAASGLRLTVAAVNGGKSYWSCSSSAEGADGSYSCTFTGGTVPDATCTAFAAFGAYVSNSVTFAPS